MSRVAGAPDLADIGAANHFATETVDGASRQVLVFPRGGGVSLRTAGLVDPISHSVVMVFRLAGTGSGMKLTDDAYVQVALTSEATLAGAQWTVAYVDGSAAFPSRACVLLHGRAGFRPGDLVRVAREMRGRSRPHEWDRPRKHFDPPRALLDG